MLYIIRLTTLTIFITLLHSAHSQSCEANYTFDNSNISCSFDYNYLDAACTQFNFISCTWTECQTYTTVDGQTTCLSYNTQTAIGWNLCTNKCCEQGVKYRELYSSITQCQNYLSQTPDNLATIIGWSIFGGVFFVVGVVFLICYIDLHGCPFKSRFKCECLSKCCGSLREFFRKICCECVLLKREVPEHAEQGDTGKDIEMTMNPEMNTPT